jgi:hypothetical protein
MHWKDIWIGLDVLFLVPFTFLFVMAAFPDGPPVQDQDLQLREVPLPAAQNAYPLYQEIADRVKASGYREESLPKPAAFIDVKPFDPRTIDPLVQQNQVALKVLKQALSRKGVRRTTVTDLMNPPWFLDEVSSLSNLYAFQGKAYLQRNQLAAARQVGFDLLRLGQQLSDLKTLLACSIGMLQQSQGIVLLHDWLGKIPLTASEAKATLKELAFYHSFKPQLKQCFCAEYQFYKTVIKKQHDGWIPYAYKPNETFNLLAQQSRLILANMDLPLNSQMSYPLQTMPWWEFLLPNGPGKALVNAATPRSSSLFFHFLTQETAMGVLETAVAMRGYRAEHGAYPHSLNALVPGYLKVVPTDWFDGQPLRYDPMARRIYSIGWNQTAPRSPEQQKNDTPEVEAVRKKRQEKLLTFTLP